MACILKKRFRVIAVLLVFTFWASSAVIVSGDEISDSGEGFSSLSPDSGGSSGSEGGAFGGESNNGGGSDSSGDSGDLSGSDSSGDSGGLSGSDSSGDSGGLSGSADETTSDVSPDGGEVDAEADEAEETAENEAVAGENEMISGDDPVTAEPPVDLVKPAVPAPDAMVPAEELFTVLFPSSVPFDMVIGENSGEGFVTSEEFFITNKGDNAVVINLSRAYIRMDDPSFFTVSDTSLLPAAGNNIYIEVISSLGGVSKTTPLMGEASTPGVVFLLESGETGSFRFGGAVNEFGDKRWTDTNIKISLSFDLKSPGGQPSDLPAKSSQNQGDSAHSPADNAVPELYGGTGMESVPVDEVRDGGAEDTSVMPELYQEIINNSGAD